MNIFNRWKEWSDSRGITAQEVGGANDWTEVSNDIDKLHARVIKHHNCSGYVVSKLEELAEYADGKITCDEDEIVDAIADSMTYDATELCKMGYDIEKVLNEVLKVVESRVGKWNNELGKFDKDKSPEAKANWYRPDYVNNCKV